MGRKQHQSACNGRAVLEHLPRRDSTLAGQVPGAAPPWRAHPIPKGLKSVRRGCRPAGNAGHAHQGIMDGRDRKGKLHCHLAFRSVCSRLSRLLDGSRLEPTHQLWTVARVCSRGAVGSTLSSLPAHPPQAPGTGTHLVPRTVPLGQLWPQPPVPSSSKKHEDNPQGGLIFHLSV